MLFRSIRKTWIPAMYQGKARMRGYFEGWYYKFADRAEQNIGALIPGVSFDRRVEDPHCFIQFLDDSGTLSHYYRYAIGEFSYSQDRPEIRIGKSVFSPTRLEVDIDDSSTRIRGAMDLKDITPWPVTLFSPGAMGWYAFVPRMECYHGVLSFDHRIEGRLELDGKPIDYTGGRGYTEKDWGRSFPSYHIWMQSNHFGRPGTSLMVSIANIPWLRRYFDGFLIGFLHDGRLYRFATYTGARITAFQHDKDRLVLRVESRLHRLDVEVTRRKGADLLVPVLGAMRGRLSESLSAETSVRLHALEGDRVTLVFEGTGRHAGLEIEGNIPVELRQ